MSDRRDSLASDRRDSLESGVTQSAPVGAPRPSPRPSPRIYTAESQPLLGAHGGRHGEDFYSDRLSSNSSSAEEDDNFGACPSGCGRESIYRFAIVYPELHRVRHGSYYSCDVCVAMLLLLMTSVFQAYIVQIAGSYIFHQSLLSYRSGVQAPRSSNDAWFRPESLPLFLRRTGRLMEPIVAPSQGEECCRAVSCSAKFACCASSLRTANQTSGRPQAVIKPQRLDAMCYQDDSGLDCGPPSFQLIDRWHELDVDGDGLWSREEAAADAANLGCRLQLSQAELLRTVSLGILEDSVVKRELDLANSNVPHEVASMNAVPREYFKLWEGLAVVCAVGDPARCGGLVHDGVFDGALGPSATGRWNLVNAMEYCGRLLMPGGLCDKTLPVTYALHRQSLGGQCGSGVYSAGPLTTNPHNYRDSLRSVSVRYTKVADYELVHSLTFRFFVAIILVLWFVTVNKEVESVLTMLHFVMHFPSNHDNPLRIPRSDLSWIVLKRSVNDTLKAWKNGETLISGRRMTFETRMIIYDITFAHRITCWCVLILRVVNLFYMLAVGIVYSTCTHSYVDLLMNTVALAFVFELPEMFYQWVVPEHVKEVLSNVELAPIDTVKGLNSKLLRFASAFARSRFFQGLVLIPIIAVAIVQVNDALHTLPMLEVLRCACLQSGPTCEVGRHLTREWWSAYWNATARIASEAPA